MNGIIHALNNNDTTHNYDYTIFNDALPPVIDYNNMTKYKNLNELKIQEIEKFKINVNNKITKEKKCYGNVIHLENEHNKNVLTNMCIFDNSVKSIMYNDKVFELDFFVNIYKCVSKNFIMFNEDIHNTILSFISGFNGTLEEQYEKQLKYGRIVYFNPLVCINKYSKFYIQKYVNNNEPVSVAYSIGFVEKNTYPCVEEKKVSNISNVNIQKHILTPYVNSNIQLFIKPKRVQKYIYLKEGENIYYFKKICGDWYFLDLQDMNVNLENVFIRSSLNVFNMDLKIKRKNYTIIT